MDSSKKVSWPCSLIEVWAEAYCTNSFVIGEAARAAIAEKGRIDQRLAIRVKRAGEAEARREAGRDGNQESGS